MNILNVRNLTMSYGVDVLYEEVAFGVSDGERVAVVGPNGCGKSTLFKIIAGELAPDGGDVTLRTGTSVGYLAQTVDFPAETTPREVVARAMQPVREAIAEFRALSERISASMAADALDELLERQAHLQQRIQAVGGWDWEHHVEEMLDRLGVSAWIDEPMERLSGGQRRRVDLARVLLEAPDLLLLDEPTNHLDADAVEWLEGWLRGRTNALLLITHDRYFLEHVVERIVEIDDEGFYDYPGNFQTFMERKLHRMAIRERTESRRHKLLEKELAWLRGGVKARNTRSKKRIKQIEELRREGPAYEDERMQMELAGASRFGDQILAATGVWKRFGDTPLLEGAHLSLRPGDKVGIVGPNGCGKTTLLKLLLGLERPDAGSVERGSKTDIAYLRQEHLAVDPSATVYEALGESDYVWVGRRRFHKRDYLDRFLFDRDLQRSQVRHLSGGQRRRLGLARLVAENANLLVLDEPTNDLDILSLQALESALEDFDGCIIAVSHDRFFLNRVCNAIVAFEDRRLVRYAGDYDHYRRKRDERREAATSPAPATQDARPAPAPKPPPSKRLTFAEKRRLEELEASIADAEARQQEVEAALSDPTLYAERPTEIEPLNRELQQIEARIDALWEEWAALEERRDA